MVDTVDSKSAAGSRREGSSPSSPTYQPPFSGEVMFAYGGRPPANTQPHTYNRERFCGIGRQHADKPDPNFWNRPCVSRLVLGGIYGSLAQLVEHRTFNPRVAGSIPARPTILFEESRSETRC